MPDKHETTVEYYYRQGDDLSFAKGLATNCAWGAQSTFNTAWGARGTPLAGELLETWLRLTDIIIAAERWVHEHAS